MENMSAYPFYDGTEDPAEITVCNEYVLKGII